MSELARVCSFYKARAVFSHIWGAILIVASLSMTSISMAQFIAGMIFYVAVRMAVIKMSAIGVYPARERRRIYRQYAASRNLHLYHVGSLVGGALLGTLIFQFTVDRAVVFAFGVSLIIYAFLLIRKRQLLKADNASSDFD